MIKGGFAWWYASAFWLVGEYAVCSMWNDVCGCIGHVYAHSCASEFIVISWFGLVGKQVEFPYR